MCACYMYGLRIFVRVVYLLTNIIVCEFYVRIEFFCVCILCMTEIIACISYVQIQTIWVCAVCVCTTNVICMDSDFFVRVFYLCVILFVCVLYA